MHEEQDETLLDRPQETEASDALWLYILHAQDTRFVKIGYTNDVQRRRDDLQVGCPHLLDILYAVPCTETPLLETLIHEHLGAYHVRGEWFELPEDVPTALGCLAFVQQQVTWVDPKPLFDPQRWGPQAAEIMRTLAQHSSLSTDQLREYLGKSSGDTDTLRVQLHRLCKAGLILRVSYGNYKVATGEDAMRRV